jgi:hypothetical protein
MAMERNPEPPPSPRAALVRMLRSKMHTDRLREEIKELHPEYPYHGSSVFVWHTLRVLGYMMPYASSATEFYTIFVRHGAQFLPAAVVPNSGDIYVCMEPTGVVTEMGFVMGGKNFEKGRVTVFSPVDEIHRKPLSEIACWIRPFG